MRTVYDGDIHKGMTKQDYRECRALGYDGTNSWVQVIDIIRGMNDKVVVRFYNEIHIVKIDYYTYDEPSFLVEGIRFSFANMIRMDI